jgi:hypothetical protein
LTSSTLSFFISIAREFESGELLFCWTINLI